MRMLANLMQQCRCDELPVLLVLLITALLPVTLARAQDDPARVAFERASCGTCHGSEAEGIDPMLVPMIYDLNALTSLVRQGIGHMPAMPRSQVSDNDLALVHEYLSRLGDARQGVAPISAITTEDFRARLNNARRSNDLDTLQAIAEEAGRAARSNDLAFALATWEQVTQSSSPPEDSAQRIDYAIAGIERVLTAQESKTAEDAVTHAFLAALSALRISVSSAPDERHDGIIERELDHALRLAPESPRVLFLAGAAAALAPEAAGSPEAAESRLQRALMLFNSSPPRDAWPDWNGADAYAWLGRELFKRGDIVGARRAYQRALELEPAFLWIIRILLLELTR